MEGRVTEVATPGVWEARVSEVNQLLRRRRDVVSQLTTELAQQASELAQQRALFRAHYEEWGTPEAEVPEVEQPPPLVTVRAGGLEGVLDVRTGRVAAAGREMSWEEFDKAAAQWVWVGGEVVPREQWVAALGSPAQLAAFVAAGSRRREAAC